MVPLSKSGLRKQRGFESHPLRHWTLDATGGACRRRSFRSSLTHLPGALASVLTRADGAKLDPGLGGEVA